MVPNINQFANKKMQALIILKVQKNQLMKWENNLNIKSMVDWQDQKI